jgi:hypothetical protein
MPTLAASWKRGVLGCLCIVLGILTDAYAQVIGPLKNEDPKEISAISGQCTRHDERMKCHLIQILVRQPRSAEDRKKAVEELIAQWRKEKKENKDQTNAVCAGLPRFEQDMRAQFPKPEQAEERNHWLAWLRQWKKFCADPSSVRNTREFAQSTIDNEALTCQVELFGPWEIDFAQQSEDLWVAKQGPQGVCGTVNVITLEKGKNSEGLLGWTYRTKRVITNRQGDKDYPESMRVCDKLQEQTLTFSARVGGSSKWRNCSYIDFSLYAPSP